MPPLARLRLTLLSQERRQTVDAAFGRLIVAGWSGRDRAAMEAHIAELEQLGVRRPARMPTFYRIAAARLTTAPRIQVTGPDSSGEVEFVLARIGGEIWVGVGSDHTDRAVEGYDVTVSKQMCDKPLAPVMWPLREVAPHWDALQLRSFRVENGTPVPYQEGSVAALLPPGELTRRLAAEDGRDLADGDALMGGTLPARDGVRPAARFAFSLIDPVLGRRIEHAYDVETLHTRG